MKTKYPFIFILFLSVSFSCSKKINPITSNFRYDPIPKVSIENYKSPQLRDGQDEKIAIGLAISGGGSRAQYFGLGVLMGLDEIDYKKNINSSFLNEVDYISTVSGGGLGVGYYLSLREHLVLDDYENLFDFWKSDIRSDSLISAPYQSASLLALRKLRTYERKGNSGFPKKMDKEILQFEKSYSPKKIKFKKLYLGHFFIEKESEVRVKLPMFVVNGTIYHNNERIPFMPHIVNELNISGSLMPKEEFKNFNDGYGFPLNHAIVSSNSFPGILPITKYEIKGSEKVIRIVDGGVVENFGFKTIFELLNSDENFKEKKRALIIDCHGGYDGNQFEPNERVKLKKLLPSALFYTLETRYLTADEDINQLAYYYGFDSNNIKKIGFSTIKNKFIEELPKANKKELEDFEKYKLMLINERVRKNGKEKSVRKRNKNLVVCLEFIKRLNKIKGIGNLDEEGNKIIYNATNFSNIPTAMFSKFSLSDIFLIYELSSQVKTKLKIYPWEKDILVLAGRFAVYLEKNNLEVLLE